MRPHVTPLAHSTVRWASVGTISRDGWELAWAQTIGLNHPSISEDAVGHSFPQPACAGGAVHLVVTDGVGSGARPEVAANALTAHCLQLPDTAQGNPTAIANWVAAADAVVAQALTAVHHRPGAAMLAAAWLAQDGTGHLVRVGDARVYRFDAHTCILEPLTQDQTYAHMGEAPPPGGHSDDPARMVGSGCMGTPEVQHLSLAPHHTMLLCTDGLARGAEAATLAAILGAATLAEGLDGTARDLCLAALHGGSQDDITVLLARRVPHV